MPEKSPPPPANSWLWTSLTSIRLTVILLLVLAAVAVIGTVVPQGEPAGFYMQRFGPNWGGLLVHAGLAAVYYSPWFLAPVALLALNILSCVIHGLPQALRRSLRPFTAEAALALPERAKFTWRAERGAANRVAALLRPELGRPRRESLADKTVLLYEKGRLRPLGPYIVHLSLLLILAGGLIGKFWGIEGQLLLNTGDEASAFELGPRTKQPLNFQVRLDNFQVQFYDQGGTPKEFRSDLTFIQDGRSEHQVCRVNYPVTFGGYTFYQASYGSEPSGAIGLKACQGDDCRDLEVQPMRRVELPWNDAKLLVIRADGNLQGLGPAVQLAYQSGPGHPQILWVLKDHPKMSQASGPVRFTLTSLPFRYYSVFQVKHDPGVWWVYAGFILLLPGFFIAFFLPRQRWAVVLEPAAAGGFKGSLRGRSPRAREAFAARQEKLMEMLKGGAQA